ncbi:MAG: hypothetical protein R3D85_11715 [Paracoccaceae bacterium]
MFSYLKAAGLALFLVLLPTLAAADDAPVTCQQTTDRVLKPFLDAVQIAEDAKALHAEETARKIKRFEDYIADMQAARQIFEDAQTKANVDAAKRIEAAEQAIADIQAEIARRQAEMNTALADAQSRNAENEAKRIRQSIATYAANVASDSITGYAPHLGFSRNIAGWRAYIADESRKLSELNASYTAGKVSHYVPVLGYSPNWQGILKLIADTEKAIAHAAQRLETFYMPMLGYSLDGPKVDKLLADRQEALAKARAEIAAGTFRLYVPTYGHSTDRTHVLADIGKARASLARVRAGWGDGSYRNYNPLVGSSVTKGAIDDWIRDTQAELAAYLAAGNEARAYVKTGGYTTTGAELLRHIAEATTDKARQDLQRHYRSWQDGRGEVIEKLQARLQKHREQLAKHHEIWLEDIAKREEELAGRLARALAETPCGGGTPEMAHADRMRDRLEGLSEHEIERACREGIYGDHVYTTPDGQVHGDARAGFLAAAADTGVGDGSMTEGTEPDVPLDQTVLMLKNYADQLAAVGEFLGDQYGTSTAIAKINALAAQIDAFQVASKSDWRKFKKMRNAALRDIRQSLDEVMESTLYITGKGMDEAIEALSNIRGLAGHLKGAEAQAALTRLRDARRLANTLSTRQLPRMADLAADLARVTDANLDAARSMFQTVRSGDVGSAIGKMSKLDKGLLFLSFAAATAEASDRMNAGESPYEAVPRAGVNLAVELAIGGIPITAAAHAATLIIFNGAALMVDDPTLAGALSDFNIENVAKIVAQAALDQAAAAGAALGEATAAAEFDALDNSASRDRIEAAIAEAENRLNQAQANSADARDLMRARARLRQLLRAKDRAERIRESEARLDRLQSLEAALRGDRDGAFSATAGAEVDMERLQDDIRRERELLDRLRKFDC